MTLKAVSKKFLGVLKGLFFFYPFTFMRSLNELLNSGKTLTKKETEVVERYIEANSTRISLEELNYLKCKAAIHERWKK